MKFIAFKSRIHNLCISLILHKYVMHARTMEIKMKEGGEIMSRKCVGMFLLDLKSEEGGKKERKSSC